MTFWRILRSGALWPGMKTGVQLARKMQKIMLPIIDLPMWEMTRGV